MSFYILLTDIDRVVFVLFVALSTTNVQIQIMSSEYFRSHFLPGCIYFRPQIISFNLLAFEEMSVLSILPQRNVQTQTKLDHIIITCFRVLPAHEKPNQLLNVGCTVEGALKEFGSICNQYQNNNLRISQPTHIAFCTFFVCACLFVFSWKLLQHTVTS